MKNIFTVSIALLFAGFNASATKHVITASGITFNPNNISNVLVGDTIRWVWQNGSHTTTSLTIPGGAAPWDNPLNNTNQSFEYPVTVAGTYNYKCTPHFTLGMTGSFIASYDCSTLNCDDTDACTADDCNSASGCIATPIVCDDLDACTTDGCNPASGCETTPVDCDDSDACTTDACDAVSGCSSVPILCDDADACTTDGCNPASGCETTAVDCDDSDECTTDGCDAISGCSNTAVVCDDGIDCTTDDCDPLTGCTTTPIICDDGDICTSDSCDSGNCIFTPISGCSNPCDTLACDDGDLCTTDTCSNGSCNFTPVLIEVSISPVLDTILRGDSLSLSGNSIPSGLVFSWTPSTSLSCAVCLNPIASPEITTTYTLFASDANGCSGSASALVVVLSDTLNPGVNEFSLSDNIRIYPQPSQDVLTVEIAKSTITKIFITDILGGRVYDSEKLNVSKYSIKLNDLVKGIYLIGIMTNEGAAIKKVLVE